MQEIYIKQEKELTIAAKAFIDQMGKTRIFAFYGEMGAGKTTFIKAICNQLDVYDNISSPTFALVYEYHSELKGTIFHLDLYRIKNLEELYDLGYEDYLYSGNLCFIEWPEMAEDLLPDGTKKVIIRKNSDNSRTVII